PRNSTGTRFASSSSRAAYPDLVRSVPAAVEVREVGPRDGLQNESPVAVADRVRLIDALSSTGLRRIEAASFVSPKAIPPMAGSEDVMARIDRVPDVVYSALVPNLRGAERALAAGADEIEVVVSASETHNRKNVNRSVDDSLTGAAELIALGHEAGTPVEAIVSTSFGCPYEGDIPAKRVADVARRLADAGADRLSFGDTTGMATPRRVDELLDALHDVELDTGTIGLHFHNTRGTALANVLAGIDRGVTRYDASIGGLGGCPYAPGASGNAVTEDLVHMLEDMGIDTGIDLDALLACAALAQDIVGRELPSALLHAGPRTRRYES
ncbi:MAG: hydroxymethylglutaryl-CoA lyase, partial [Actinomycetota bacterium]|nr:hydroxymethylglutaryl-CoA lyase [Actinomycetota bacterium]